jgi:hypothetical protein
MRQQPRARRRSWLRVGPGLLVALVASAAVWHLMPPEPAVPTRLSEVTLEGDATTRPSAPEPYWVLEQAEALKLNAAQRQELRRLWARWHRDTQALSAELARAQAEFSRQMEADRGRPVSMHEMRERVGPVSELSRQLNEARRAWWDDTARALTAAQSRRVERMWASRLSRKRARPAESASRL